MCQTLDLPSPLPQVHPQHHLKKSKFEEGRGLQIVDSSLGESSFLGRLSIVVLPASLAMVCTYLVSESIERFQARCKM
jgi:hypothetical protein